LFEIQDSGLGITSEQQPLVFTKFFRGSNFNSTDIMGAGLGLYIAKGCVTLLKGKIWFKSEENKGTTFYVQIPMAA
jgi:two-component system sensor histidine kinase VicK